MKRQRRSPPAPGTSAFEDLPAVTLPFVVYISFLFAPIFIWLRVSASAGATALETKAAFDSVTPKYVLFYIDTLLAFSHVLEQAGLSPYRCALTFII